ncbi:PHD-finger, partial [Cooperia oncophora]
MSSPGADDVCPICLCPIDEEFSRPENCQHRFDSDCLKEWSKLRLSCPSCRATFGAVYTYKIVEGKPTLHKVQKMEEPAEAEPFDETNPLDFTVCEICSGGMHEELLLICDQCDKGFHTYCLTPPLDGVPTTEQWFCPQCEESRVNRPSTSRTAESSARAIRLVQRTALAERVRRRLARNRRIVETSRSATEEEESDGND